MKVKLAKTAGFCTGVKDAVDLVLRTAVNKKGPIYTWGPLIHNPQVVEFLRGQGIGVAEDYDALDEKSTAVIRSHGIPPDVRNRLKETGANICDATCKKVARVQAIVKSHSAKGRDVVIIGHDDHAEVVGLLGFADEHGYVVSEIDDVRKLPELQNPVVIGQTTLRRDWYDERANAVAERFPSAEIFDTLCDSTSARQDEIVRLAEEVDSIVIVGGYNSSNTKRLFEAAKSTGVNTFWVETASEIDPSSFAGAQTVAVSAGASTPHWIVSEVIERLERINEGKLPLWSMPFIKDFGYIIIQSNILTGFAAAMLTAAFMFLAGFPIHPLLLISMGLFVFGFHAIYNIVDWQGVILADPAKLSFFWSNRRLLGLSAVLGLFVSTGLMVLFGFEAFILTLIAGISAGLFLILKNYRIFPLGKKLVTLREIPGARDLLHVLGWSFACGLVPLAAAGFDFSPAAILALAWIALLAFLRATLFSISDLENDRVLGRESLTTVIGEKSAWAAVYFSLITNFAILITGVVSRLFPPITLLLLIFIAYIFLIIAKFRRWGIGRGTWAELAFDGGFALCGIISILASIVM